MRFVCLFAVLLIVPFLFMPSQAHPDSSPQQGGPPPAMPVIVEEVVPQETMIWKEFSGRIQAVDYVEVRPQVSGTITEILFEDGAHVKKDEILLTIDKRPYEAALRRAQAALLSAENQLNLADKERVRAEGLIKTNAISKSSYDERVNARNVAAAQVDAAKADVDQAQINLDYASVKAPVSGYVSRAEVTEGNLVDPAAGQILTTIVSDAGVYADFDVDEKTYLSAIRLGVGKKVNIDDIQVEVSSPSLPEMVQKGKIHAFDNRIDPASGTIRVRAYLSNPDKILLPGMFVNVKVGSASADKLILLRETAIGTDQDRKFVLVADNGKAAYRPVTLGIASDGKREIKSGLGAGDKVIIEGLMHVRPDMPVDPKTAEEMAAMMQQQAAASGVPSDAAGAKPEDSASEEKVGE